MVFDDAKALAALEDLPRLRPADRKMMNDQVIRATGKIKQLVCRPGRHRRVFGRFAEDPRIDAFGFEDACHGHGIGADRILAGQYGNQDGRLHWQWFRILMPYRAGWICAQ